MDNAQILIAHSRLKSPVSDYQLKNIEQALKNIAGTGFRIDKGSIGDIIRLWEIDAIYDSDPMHHAELNEEYDCLMEKNICSEQAASINTIYNAQLMIHRLKKYVRYNYTVEDTKANALLLTLRLHEAVAILREECPEKTKEAYIGGSYSRRMARPDSDADIIFVHPAFGESNRLWLEEKSRLHDALKSRGFETSVLEDDKHCQVDLFCKSRREVYGEIIRYSPSVNLADLL